MSLEAWAQQNVYCESRQLTTGARIEIGACDLVWQRQQEQHNGAIDGSESLGPRNET